MYINYSKIITHDFKIYVTEKEFNELKEMAKKEKECLKRKYNADSLRSMLSSKATETAYKTSKYHKKNDFEKAILASNIVFDNEEFASILEKGNFKADTLKSYLKLLNYLKYKMSIDGLDEKDKKYAEKADNFAKKLVAQFAYWKTTIDHTIIINKINEVLSFEPELIENKQPSHTR